MTTLPADRKERAAYFGRFRDALICDPDLKAAAKVVGCALLAHINQKSDDAFPSMGRLAGRLHMARSHVGAAIKLLVSCEWFTKTAGGGGTTNRYSINPARVPDSSPFWSPDDDGKGAPTGPVGVSAIEDGVSAIEDGEVSAIEDGSVRYRGHDSVEGLSRETPNGARAIALEVEVRVEVLRLLTEADSSWETRDGSLVRQWLADGCDPETHIYPIIRQAAQRGTVGKIRGLRYFTGAITELRDSRPVAGPDPDAETPRVRALALAQARSDEAFEDRLAAAWKNPAEADQIGEKYLSDWNGGKRTGAAVRQGFGRRTDRAGDLPQ